MVRRWLCALELLTVVWHKAFGPKAKDSIVIVESLSDMRTTLCFINLFRNCFNN